MVDKRDQSVTQGHRLQVGDRNVFQGSVVLGTTIQESFNHITQSSGDDKLKEKLELLCSQVQDLSKALPPDKQKGSLRPLRHARE